MERAREIALVCVGRAVFFGALAIGLVMLSFAFSPVTSFRAGAILSLVMSAILLWFARTAAGRNPRDTEVWIYLDEGSRPLNEHAQRAFALVMREVYEIFSLGAFKSALGLFAISVGLQALGVETAYR